MSKPLSPIVGYNTNVRHADKVYHIQTEDLGMKRAQIITQLFADGGRIIALEKTSYKGELEIEDLAARIKALMQAQHKKIFMDLRDGKYDEEPKTPSNPPIEVLDHGTNEKVGETINYQSQIGNLLDAARVSKIPPAPFGHEFLTDKSLDEVILAYLTRDLENHPGKP